MLTKAMLRVAVFEAVFQMAPHGAISLRALREVLQTGLGVDLMSRKTCIKLMAQDAVNVFTSGTLEASLTEKDRGRHLFTEQHDALWQGTWEPLVQVRSHACALDDCSARESTLHVQSLCCQDNRQILTQTLAGKVVATGSADRPLVEGMIAGCRS